MPGSAASTFGAASAGRTSKHAGQRSKHLRRGFCRQDKQQPAPCRPSALTACTMPPFPPHRACCRLCLRSQDRQRRVVREGGVLQPKLYARCEAYTPPAACARAPALRRPHFSQAPALHPSLAALHRHNAPPWPANTHAHTLARTVQRPKAAMPARHSALRLPRAHGVALVGCHAHAARALQLPRTCVCRLCCASSACWSSCCSLVLASSAIARRWATAGYRAGSMPMCVCAHVRAGMWTCLRVCAHVCDGDPRGKV